MVYEQTLLFANILQGIDKILYISLVSLYEWAYKILSLGTTFISWTKHKGFFSEAVIQVERARHKHATNNNRASTGQMQTAQHSFSRSWFFKLTKEALHCLKSWEGRKGQQEEQVVRGVFCSVSSNKCRQDIPCSKASWEGGGSDSGDAILFLVLWIEKCWKPAAYVVQYLISSYLVEVACSKPNQSINQSIIIWLVVPWRSRCPRCADHVWVKRARNVRVQDMYFCF